MKQCYPDFLNLYNQGKIAVDKIELIQILEALIIDYNFSQDFDYCSAISYMAGSLKKEKGNGLVESYKVSLKIVKLKHLKTSQNSLDPEKVECAKEDRSILEFPVNVEFYGGNFYLRAGNVRCNLAVKYGKTSLPAIVMEPIAKEGMEKDLFDTMEKEINTSLSYLDAAELRPTEFIRKFC